MRPCTRWPWRCSCSPRTSTSSARSGTSTPACSTAPPTSKARKSAAATRRTTGRGGRAATATAGSGGASSSEGAGTLAAVVHAALAPDKQTHVSELTPNPRSARPISVDWSQPVSKAGREIARRPRLALCPHCNAEQALKLSLSIGLFHDR